MKKSIKILLTGGEGFLGTHILRQLQQKKYINVWAPGIKELNLLSPRQCDRALKKVEVVINAAGKLGGTMDNKEYPADYFYENAMTGINLIHAARKVKLKKFVQIGSVIAYPSGAKRYPLKEEQLWQGYPDETKEGYAMAKKLLLVMGKTYRQQYHVPIIHLMLTNMYGPGDHFKSDKAHVVPSLIDRFAAAKKENKESVIVWGTGKATRDFLYVKDAATAIVDAMQHCETPEPLNIASGVEVSIKEIAELISRYLKYSGRIEWDTTKPDGQLRSSYAITKAQQEFGFNPKVTIQEGLKETISWYRSNISI